MAFPSSKLGLMVELALGADLTASPSTWAFTDISSYVMFAPGITISRGRADEFTTAGPARAQLTLNNTDGRFITRNPTGPYYGQLSRNTPLRIMVRPDVNTASDAFGRTVSNGWGSADVGGAYTVVGSASDYAVTSGVGRQTHPSVSVRHYSTLPVSLTTFDARFRVRTSALATGGPLTAGFVYHYVDTGTSVRYELIFNTDASIQVRAVLRSGGTDNFGASHTVSGLTHVANTFYRVRTQSTSADGKLFRIKVWADNASEPTTWTATSFTNATSVAGPIGFTSKRETSNTNTSVNIDFEDFTFTDGWFPRHTGYVDEWPTRWADASLKLMEAPITASGITRRLQQGGALQSAIRRAVLTTFSPEQPVAYWPMEDKNGATQLASGIPGGIPMQITQPWTVGSGALIGSDPVTVSTSNGRVSWQVPTYTGTDWSIQFPLIIPSAPATSQDLMVFNTNGTYPFWQLVLTPSAGTDTLTLQAYTGFGVESLGDPGTPFVGEPYGQPLWVEITATQSGPDLIWDYFIWNIGGNSGATNTKSSATAGQVTGGYFAPPGLSGSTIGHISVWNDAAASLGAYGKFGWGSEKATSRFTRLCGQEHVPSTLIAVPTLHFASMGPPTSSTLLTQLREIETAEQGILYDGFDGSIVLLPRESRYNQTVGVTLDVAQHQVGWPLQPDDNDQQLHNSVTSTRPTGSSYTAMDTTSNLSVTEVGYYTSQVSVNLSTDTDLKPDAQFRVSLGTVDELRYPVVPLDLNRNPSLIASWLAMDVGNRMQIVNTPDVLTPDTVDMVLQGYTEHITAERWTVDCNTTSATPWNAWVLQSSTGNQGRLDSDASTLAADATAGATSISVATASMHPLWVTGSVNFDLGIGGERVTVTNISGSSSPQTFTVTRAVNQISKAQTAGTKVSLWNPNRLGL